MKALFLLLVLITVSFGAAVKDTAKTAVKAKAKAKTAVVIQPVMIKSVFDETVVVLKKQLSDIEKSKLMQKAASDKIEKEAISLEAKSDSVYNAAKASLKVIYDKESAKITVQEQTLMLAKDKLETNRGTLEQNYQDAVRSADEAKGLKKQP